MTLDKLFDGSDAHLLPGNAELIDPPHEIICYALKVGDWFKERDITHWKIADCASRNALEAADKRIAELEASVEQWKCNSRENKMIAESSERKLAVAERKLDVAREAIYMLKRHVPVESALHDQAEEALAQIGGGE